MRYKILKDGEVINTIIADEDFCKTYCEKNGYTYELIKVSETPPMQESAPQPHTEYYTYTGTDVSPITLTFTSKPLYITINNELISIDAYQVDGNVAVIDKVDYNQIGVEYRVLAMCE